jgi:hypothetical protein
MTDSAQTADKEPSVFNVVLENMTVPVEAHAFAVREGYLSFGLGGETIAVFAPGFWSQVRKADNG